MEDEIDLLLLVKKIWKKKLWIIFITINCMLIAGYISVYIMKPVYETNVNIIIGKELTKVLTDDEYTDRDVNLYLQVIKTYEEIAKSRTVSDRVRESLNNDIFNVAQSVTISSKENTQIITITITSDSIAKIELFANTYAEQFIQVANEVLPAGQLTILDRAQRPTEPISPNIKKNIAIASLLGIVLSVGLILIKEFTRQNIETEKDLEDCFDFPVLGVLAQDKL